MSYLFQRVSTGLRDAIQGSLSSTSEVTIASSGELPEPSGYGIETPYLFIINAISDPFRRDFCCLNICLEETDRISEHPVRKIDERFHIGYFIGH